MSMPASEAFRRLLIYYRKKKGLTGSQLAASVGMRQWTISRIQTGSREIMLEEAIKIAKFLGFSISDVVQLMEYAKE